MCYRSGNNHQTAKRRNSNRNMELPLSPCLWKSTAGAHAGAHLRVKTLSMGHHGPCRGFGETTTDEGHKIWSCGEDMKHQHEVASIVRKEVGGSIISCTPISSKLPPSGCQRDHTVSQPFKSMHRPQTMTSRRSNSSTSSLIGP